MKKISIILICLTWIGCSTMEHETRINGATYLARPEPYLATCKNLGVFMGLPNSSLGGQIGQAASRIDAIKSAKAEGATHFLETDTSWPDGGVIGKGYKCDKDEKSSS